MPGKIDLHVISHYLIGTLANILSLGPKSKSLDPRSESQAPSEFHIKNKLPPPLEKTGGRDGVWVTSQVQVIEKKTKSSLSCVISEILVRLDSKSFECPCMIFGW